MSFYDAEYIEVFLKKLVYTKSRIPNTLEGCIS